MGIEDVIALMKSSKSEVEWNSNCDKVKVACDGYPPDWYKEIILSGLATEVTARFGRDAAIHMSVEYGTPRPPCEA